MYKFILVLGCVSVSAWAADFEDYQTKCMESVETQVADLERAGVKLSLKESLSLYQVCLNDNQPEEQSYFERCGDRPGGANDRCTN